MKLGHYGQMKVGLQSSKNGQHIALRLVCILEGCGAKEPKTKENSYLGVKCILSKVLDLLLKATKKLFYFLINDFRTETKHHLQLKVIRDLVSSRRQWRLGAKACFQERD